MPTSLPGSQLFSNATTNVFQSLQDLYNALNTNGNISGAYSGSPERSELCQHAADILRKLRRPAKQRPNVSYPGTDAIDRNRKQHAGRQHGYCGNRPHQAETTQQALVQAGAQISQLNLFSYLPAP